MYKDMQFVLFTTGMGGYNWYGCLQLVRVVTTGMGVYKWYGWLQLVWVFTTGMGGYNWYGCLQLVRVVTSLNDRCKYAVLKVFLTDS